MLPSARAVPMPVPFDQSTRVQPPPPAPAPPPAPPLDVKTLLITAAASALAAFICSKVWAPGTLASAAFTPVAVAVFREALRKPTDVVTTALPATIPVVRRRTASGAPPAPGGPAPPEDPTQVHDVVPDVAPGPGEEATRVTPAPAPDGAHVPGAGPGTAEVHAVAHRDRRRWQLAIATGLLGFVLAALLITVPEVVAGKDRTTIFRGSGGGAATTTQTVPATTQTVIQQITTAPAETVTQTEAAPVTEPEEEAVTVTEVVPPTTTERPTTTTAPDPAQDGAAEETPVP